MEARSNGASKTVSCCRRCSGTRIGTLPRASARFFFTVSDRPALEALGLYYEEGQSRRSGIPMKSRSCQLELNPNKLDKGGHDGS